METFKGFHWHTKTNCDPQQRQSRWEKSWRGGVTVMSTLNVHVSVHVWGVITVRPLVLQRPDTCMQSQSCWRLGLTATRRTSFSTNAWWEEWGCRTKTQWVNRDATAWRAFVTSSLGFLNRGRVTEDTWDRYYLRIIVNLDNTIIIFIRGRRIRKKRVRMASWRIKNPDWPEKKQKAKHFLLFLLFTNAALEQTWRRRRNRDEADDETREKTKTKKEKHL